MAASDALLPRRTLVGRRAAAHPGGQRPVARRRVRARHPLAKLGMFAPALSYLEEPGGPVAVALSDPTFGLVTTTAARIEARNDP